jgi:hypothetical protein
LAEPTIIICVGRANYHLGWQSQLSLLTTLCCFYHAPVSRVRKHFAHSQIFCVFTNFVWLVGDSLVLYA